MEYHPELNGKDEKLIETTGYRTVLACIRKIQVFLKPTCQ